MALKTVGLQQRLQKPQAPPLILRRTVGFAQNSDQAPCQLSACQPRSTWTRGVPSLTCHPRKPGITPTCPIIARPAHQPSS